MRGSLSGRYSSYAGMAQNRVRQSQRLEETIIGNSITSRCQIFAGLNSRLQV